jgi:hypothetical protein
VQKKTTSNEMVNISSLQNDLTKAAIAVREAGHAIERMLRAFPQVEHQDVMESGEPGTVMLEILTDGAYPNPVGSPQGTAPIFNNSTVPLAVKIGDKAPDWFGPGSVILTIPPGREASIQKIRPDAPELQTQIVKWISRIKPCVPGQICLDPLEWEKDKDIGENQNAVPILVGWSNPIRFGGDPSVGFTLD